MIMRRRLYLGQAILAALFLRLSSVHSFTLSLPVSVQVPLKSPLTSNVKKSAYSRHVLYALPIESVSEAVATVSSSPTMALLTDMSREQAEKLAGPFFGASLFPYLAFLYFLDVPENDTPKGVTVGFATCLLFVFLTIPAAIAAQVLYGVSLADSDWLHGSAESLLTVTNLVTVVAFRQALKGKEVNAMPISSTSYDPMVNLVGGLTLAAVLTALVPAVLGPEVHTPYLGGFMDLPKEWINFGNDEPDNGLTIACWIIHISSLVEFLVAMGFAWRWGDIVNNQKWKGLTWGLLPLHTSGITACTYHLFYNAIPSLVPLQALLTCVGNTTAAFAAYRIAISNGWTSPIKQLSFLNSSSTDTDTAMIKQNDSETKAMENSSLIGFEDLGDALAQDNDYIFLVKLFAGCAVASYTIKYGELIFNFPFDANLGLGLAVITVPSMLNAFKWYKRSSDPNFEGWF